MLTIASHNQHKINEISAQLKTFGIQARGLKNYNILAPQEKGLSFIENALIKARHTVKHTKSAVIADDSGIIVEALNGKPGIYSARYSGANATDEKNCQKLLRQMMNITNRKAQFICAMVYLQNLMDNMPIIVQGTWEGQIAQKPKGKKGFGYDSIFYLPDYQCTAAELSVERKNLLSHRAQAIKSLMQKIPL